MLLRFVVLHGLPQTEADWSRFREWKQVQLALPECKMSDAAGAPDDRKCSECPGTPGCPKTPRRP